MLKLLLCCWMKSAAEPITIEIDIVQPPSSPVAYRPDSRMPFTEKDLKFFKDIRDQKCGKSNNN